MGPSADEMAWSLAGGGAARAPTSRSKRWRPLDGGVGEGGCGEGKRLLSMTPLHFTGLLTELVSGISLHQHYVVEPEQQPELDDLTASSDCWPRRLGWREFQVALRH